MRLERITVPCRACDAPVGVLLNIERHAFAEQQHPGLVPMCPDCGEICTRFVVTPSWLRKLFTYTVPYAAERYMSGRFRGDAGMVSALAGCVGVHIRRGGLEA